MNLPSTSQAGLSKRRIGSHFRRRKGSYESRAVVHAQTADMLLSELPRSFQPESVLEIGAHGGLLSKRWRKAYPEAWGLLLDLWSGFSPLLAPLHLSGAVADGERLPLAGASFDLILSGATFQWYESWESSLKTTLGLLRPGGILGFTQFCRPSLEPLAGIARKLGRGDGFLPLRSHDDLCKDLTGLVGQLPFELELRNQLFEKELHFEKPALLFQHLRELGVTAGASNNRPWTAQQLRTCFELLEDVRTEPGIPLRYAVGLYWLRRPLES